VRAPNVVPCGEYKKAKEAAAWTMGGGGGGGGKGGAAGPGPGNGGGGGARSPT
jgi:hypothetical protein